MSCPRCKHHYAVTSAELVEIMRTVADYHRRHHPDFKVDLEYLEYLARWLLSNRYVMEER